MSTSFSLAAAALVALAWPLVQGPGAGRAGRGGAGAAEEPVGPPVLGPDDVPQTTGSRGDRPPRAAQLVREVAAVHDDVEGRGDHELVSAAGAGMSGFAVLWSDGRTGASSLVALRLDPSGTPIDSEVSIASAASCGIQIQGALAASPPADASTPDEASPGGRVAFAWHNSGDRDDQFRLRLARWDGTFLGPELSWPLAQNTERVDPGPNPAGVPRRGPEPSVAMRANGSGAVAWTRDGRIQMREFGANGTLLEPTDTLNRKATLATGEPFLCSSSRGSLACVWQVSDGIDCFVRTTPGGGSQSHITGGQLRQLVADPRGGWWIVLKRFGRAALRRITPEGSVEEEDVIVLEPPWTSVRIAAGRQGGALLVQRGENALELGWLAVDGTQARPPERLADLVSGPIAATALAEAEGRWLLAWTERRARGFDVYARGMSFGGSEPGPTRRLNTDEASADQATPDVASAGGRVLVAWSDERNLEARAAVRMFDARGKALTDEILLPAAFVTGREGAVDSPPAGARPAIALHTSGRFLATWVESAEVERPREPSAKFALIRGSGAMCLRAQAFDAGARPIGPSFAIDPPDGHVPASFPAAVVALREDRGYAVAWVRADERSEQGKSALLVRRLSLSGELLGEARQVAEGPRLRNPAAVVLDSGRLALAWDVQPRVGERRLRARVIGEGLELDGRTIEFDTMYLGSDWDPALAPARDGGFALAWVSGEGPDRDVFARRFDAQGRPTTRPMALSTRAGAQTSPTLARLEDGTWVAAWHDDLSRNSCIAARRILARSGELGPTVWITGRWSQVIPRDLAPRVVAVPGDSPGMWAAVWTHGSERRGKEVGMCLYGSGFDAVEGR